MQDTASHSFAATMFRHIPAGIALFDARELRLVSANETLCLFLNTHPNPCWHNGGAIGHTLHEYFTAEEFERFIPILQRVMETGTTYHSDEFASPSLADPRKILYWDWSLTPIKDAQGTVTHLLLSATNILPYVRARQHAERQQERLARIYQQNEAERNRLTIIETVARAARESLSIDHIGKVTVEAIVSYFHPQVITIHTADHAQQALRLIHLNSASPKKSFDDLHHIPFDGLLLISRAHTQLDVIQIANIQAHTSKGLLAPENPLATLGVRGYICIPLWYKNRFEGTLATAFDRCIEIDGPEVRILAECASYVAAALAQARLHEEVKNEQARLRTLLDEIPEGIFIIEATHLRVLYANQAAANLLGTRVPDITGQNLEQFVERIELHALSQPDLTSWHSLVMHSLAGETTRGQEASITRQDGSAIMVVCSGAPLLAPDGHITGASIVFQDISAQKTLEQQRDDFLSIVSHELRTPITAIQGFAELLQMIVALGDAENQVSARACKQLSNNYQRVSSCLMLLLCMFVTSMPPRFNSSAYRHHNLSADPMFPS